MKIAIFLSLALFASAINAQTLKLDKEEKEVRIVLKSDSKVGAYFVDNRHRLAWLACPVGQTFIEKCWPPYKADDVETSACSAGKRYRYNWDNYCSGEPDEGTFFQARTTANKVGGGWRLPTYDEFRTIEDLYASVSLRANRAGYVFWSQSGVNNEPNERAVMRPGWGEFTDVGRSMTAKYGVLLVRNSP